MMQSSAKSTIPDIEDLGEVCSFYEGYIGA
jgi:hypothetical protein